MKNRPILSSLIVLGIGISLVLYATEMARYIVQGVGVLFLLPGLITIFNAFTKYKSTQSLPIIPLIVGGGCVLMGIVLLVIPSTFINALFYLLASLLVLGGFFQIIQLIRWSREGMKNGVVYYLFPLAIFSVGLYLLLRPLEEIEYPYLIVGYAAILYSVIELLTFIRIARYRCEVKRLEKSKSQQPVDELLQPLVEEETPDAVADEKVDA